MQNVLKELNKWNLITVPVGRELIVLM